METIYSKNGLIEQRNQEALNEIEGTIRLCMKFDISCKEINGAWGIWFYYEDKELIVNPLDLVNSIFEDDTYYILEERSKSEYVSYRVRIQMDNFCYTWRIFTPNEPKVTCMTFSLQDYLDTIKMCVNSLCKVWENGASTAYTYTLDCGIDGIRMCSKQLNVSGVTPGYYTLMTNDIKTEMFTFYPVKDKFVDQYTIGIGDRRYETFLTLWDNDYKQIRHQFEMLAYTQKAEIELFFDMSETVLKIERRSVLDQMIKTEDGTSFKYKEYALVEVIPNRFAKMPIIKGYCDYKKTVKAFYEGLLSLAMANFMHGYPHDHERMLAYNKIKSPIIEHLITGNYRDDTSYETRQQIVKTILTIEPDYDQVFVDEECCSYSFDRDGLLDEDNLYDREGNPICMKEMYEWQQEIEPIVIASATGQPYSKDWRSYHERGLKLAHELRKRLSPEIDLWYDAPYEDKSGIINHPMLIL